MKMQWRFVCAAIAAFFLLASAPNDYKLSKGAYKEVALDGRKRVEIKAAMLAASYDTYRFDVPPGLAKLEVEVITHGEDLDLAVRVGLEIASYVEKGGCDYRDFDSDPDPAFIIDNPPPGPLYIDVVNLGSFGAEYKLRAATKKAKA